MKQWLQQTESEFLKDLGDLIRYPSISKKNESAYPFGEACASVLNEALERAKSYGMQVQNIENCYGLAVLPGNSPRTIGIFCHLDVVPAGDGWSQNPYEMSVRNGMICGRGCGDNKGPALAALYALRYLAESGKQLRHSICLFFGCNEEAGMEDIKYYLKMEKNQPVFSFVPDARLSVCVGEKGHVVFSVSREIHSQILLSLSAGSVPNSVPGQASALVKLPKEVVERALRHCGVPYQAFEKESCITEILVFGKAAHAAFPEGSVHAQKRLAQVLCTSGLLETETAHALEGVISFLEDDYGKGLGIAFSTPEFGQLTAVSGITRLEGRQLRMTFDIRYPVGFQWQTMKETVVARLRQFGFSLEKYSDSPGYYRDPKQPAIQYMKTVAQRVWEREFPVYTMGGGTYARLIPNAVPFGPGLPRESSSNDEGRGDCHQPDEMIGLEVLQKGIEIYAEVLCGLDQMID